MENWQTLIQSFDDRRDIVIPGDAEKTVLYCVQQFIQIAQKSIQDKGVFTVALSGGSTPNAIYKLLSQEPYSKQIDWTKVLLFWGDERSVPPEHADSNYRSAMQAGLASLPIPKEHIFRMQAEKEIEESALQYEQQIGEFVPSKKFDLVMLGMGEDGHTASLFPQTHGLHTMERVVVANHVPQKSTWRMTLTYECIHSAHHISIYVIGANKAEMVKRCLNGKYEPDLLPIQRIGTPHHKALWILDLAAAKALMIS